MEQRQVLEVLEGLERLCSSTFRKLGLIPKNAKVVLGETCAVDAKPRTTREHVEEVALSVGPRPFLLILQRPPEVIEPVRAKQTLQKSIQDQRALQIHRPLSSISRLKSPSRDAK